MELLLEIPLGYRFLCIHILTVTDRWQVDRDALAKELGFEGLMMNSLNAVGDRDFATETLQWAAMLMGHISRISEDMTIYSTAEFGFLKLSDAYSTGSSLMPQKVRESGLSIHPDHPNKL